MGHFYGTYMPGFLYCLNIQVLTVCTVQVGRCVTFMRAIERRADDSLCFRIALVPTLVSFLIRAQRRFKSNKRTNTCAYLYRFDRSL